MAPDPNRRIVQVRGVVRVRSTGREFKTSAPTNDRTKLKLAQPTTRFLKAT